MVGSCVDMVGISEGTSVGSVAGLSVGELGGLEEG